ncbi:MAG TPA: YciI family protein, partial [Mycobacterium sp.]|nr:YciI family protein [Mycobacterium sp.]
YQGGPAPVVDCPPPDQWAPEEWDAHVQFMRGFGARLEEAGEFVDAQALSPEGAFVRGDEQGQPITDGPFAETKDLIAGWYVVDVDGWDRAIALAGELSLAPGAGGRPIHEWLEVRPFMGSPTTVAD